MRSTFYSFGFALAALFAINVPVCAQENASAPIEIAIAPFLPIATLIQNYEPLVKDLEQQLKRRVILLTAPDYRSYNERLIQGKYTFVIAVANSAYLAITDADYMPLLRPDVYSRPALVVRKDSAAQRVADLKNTKLATTDAMGIIAMQGAAMLRDAGLDPTRDVSLNNFANHTVAVNFVLSGEMDGAVISDRGLLQMPAIKRDALRVIHVWEQGAAPGIVYLVNKNVPSETATQVRDAIAQFTRDTEAGRALMAQFGYGALLPVTVEELKFLAPYGVQLKALLQKAP